MAKTVDDLAAGDVLVLAGSTPDGTGRAHAAMSLAARDRGVHVVVDASGSALDGLLETRPEAVKVSVDEARELGGTRDASADAGRPGRLADVPIVGITDGEAGLRAWLPDGRAMHVTPPPSPSVVATLGAGDAVTAGLAIAIARGDDPLEGSASGRRWPPRRWITSIPAWIASPPSACRAFASARSGLALAANHHERIRALSGSYSGSRMTSKPTQSPNTSTSPRVPIGGRAAGRRRRSSARPRSP